MLRISKLTDYGILLLVELARESGGAHQNARELAERTGLPQPAVSKMLKTLSGSELLTSQRGSKGGYALARAPQEVSVAEIIRALEGPIALMECVAGPGHCEQESHCDLRDPWQRINQAVQDTLERVTLAELVGPSPGVTVEIEGVQNPHVV